MNQPRLTKIFFGKALNHQPSHGQAAHWQGILELMAKVGELNGCRVVFFFFKLCCLVFVGVCFLFWVLCFFFCVFLL